MKTIAFIFSLMLASSVQAFPAGHDLDRFNALSAIETRDNDFAGGKAGEVSRLAITPRVWKQYAGNLTISAAVNPATAFNVGEAVMRDRVRRFEKREHRQPTENEFALLWHCPGRRHRPTVSDLDYAARFVNTLNQIHPHHNPTGTR
jgi:hypothetical protein